MRCGHTPTDPSIREPFPCLCGLGFSTADAFAEHRCHWRVLFRRCHLSWWLRLDRVLGNLPEPHVWRCECGHVGRTIAPIPPAETAQTPPTLQPATTKAGHEKPRVP